MQGLPTPLAVVGMGAVGLRLALRWQQAGAKVRTFSRSESSRARAREAGLEVGDELDAAVRSAPCLVLCVAAPALEELAMSLATGLERRGERPVSLHTSASHGGAPLRALAALGAPIGVLHPLAAFPPDGPGPDFGQAWCAVGGEARARVIARRLVEALGARTLELGAGEDAALRYHASAALLSNGAVALSSLAFALGEAACQDPTDARTALGALLRGTVDNLARASPERALTGPVARGELETVRAHLSLLADHPQALRAYRDLSLTMVELAVRDGRLENETAGAFERLLAP